MPAPISFESNRRESFAAAHSYSMLSGSFGAFAQYRQHTAMADVDAPSLEVDFCKDFSCCGLVLDDLHDLLQHYEEQHVRADDDASSFGSSPVSSSSYNPHAASARPNRPDLDALKRKALADMHYHLGLPDTSAVADEEMPLPEIDFSRKRPYRPSMSAVTHDFLTPVQSPESSTPSTPHPADFELDNPMLYGGMNGDDWVGVSPQLKKMRPTPTSSGYATPLSSAMSPPQVIEHPASSLVVVDKPFKCPVRGCDKAYKNQNGLKYHKMHGNCANDPAVVAAAAGGDGTAAYGPHIESKPYCCNVCNKRYKNLNGLKYHAAHSHQNITVDSIQNQMFQQAQAQW
ncbi:Transcriptional regulator of ribosomal bioproteinsis proteins [Savitreella phatthalungensis]